VINDTNTTRDTLNNFCTTVWDYFKEHGRSFSWRNIDNPYYVLVSEVMLQQTQTVRVKEKYEQFIARFPTVESLAHASLQDLLFCWQGLGYNRRALFLQKTAQKIVTEHAGIVPADPHILVTFPGIGKATSASICAFAFNIPTVFVETNIRAVFIHFFFAQQDTVDDKEIVALVSQTLDRVNPRHWYYALMDYGVMLKKQLPNPSRKSKHYTKQSKFEGSDRQIRGAILKLLTTKPASQTEIIDHLHSIDPNKINRIVNDLCTEGFLEYSAHIFAIKSHREILPFAKK
jgi:A/G-specific adenine glycosylase